MCFSAEASFISSAVLTVAGIATIKQVKDPSAIPLALLPLIFAFHQLIEGGLWLTSTYNSPIWLIALLAHIFPLIAYCVWPILAPLAIRRIETNPLRRKLLMGCLIVGIGVSLFFLFYILKGPVTVKYINQSIHYDFYFSFWIISQWLYGFSIIVAAFFSSHRIVNGFGVGLIISYNIAKQFYVESYPSVFCFLAAGLSIIIYLQIRYGREIKNNQHLIRRSEMLDKG